MTKAIEGAVKGRPSLYTDKLAEEIAEKVANGATIKEAIAGPNMPSMRTVMQWAAEKPHFRTILLRAREAQVESLVGMMWEEALNADDGNIRTAQLRVNTIQWLLARYSPKKFSERVLAEIAKQPEPPVEKTPPIDWDYLTSDERETLLQLTQLAEHRRESVLTEENEEGEQGNGTGE